MLLEVVSRNRLLMFGTVAAVRNRLIEHARRYTTLKEFLADRAPH